MEFTVSLAIDAGLVGAFIVLIWRAAVLHTRVEQGRKDINGIGDKLQKHIDKYDESTEKLKEHLSGVDNKIARIEEHVRG